MASGAAWGQERAREQRQAGRGRDRADEVDLGYVDQAHFIADFRKRVGTAPAACARTHAGGRRSARGTLTAAQDTRW